MFLSWPVAFPYPPVSLNVTYFIACQKLRMNYINKPWMDVTSWYPEKLLHQLISWADFFLGGRGKGSPARVWWNYYSTSTCSIIFPSNWFPQLVGNPDSCFPCSMLTHQADVMWIECPHQSFEVVTPLSAMGVFGLMMSNGYLGICSKINSHGKPQKWWMVYVILLLLIATHLFVWFQKCIFSSYNPGNRQMLVFQVQMQHGLIWHEGKLIVSLRCKDTNCSYPCMQVYPSKNLCIKQSNDIKCRKRWQRFVNHRRHDWHTHVAIIQVKFAPLLQPMTGPPGSSCVRCKKHSWQWHNLMFYTSKHCIYYQKSTWIKHASNMLPTTKQKFLHKSAFFHMSHHHSGKSSHGTFFAPSSRTSYQTFSVGMTSLRHFALSKVPPVSDSENRMWIGLGKCILPVLQEGPKSKGEVLFVIITGKLRSLITFQIFSSFRANQSKNDAGPLFSGNSPANQAGSWKRAAKLASCCPKIFQALTCGRDFSLSEVEMLGASSPKSGPSCPFRWSSQPDHPAKKTSIVGSNWKTYDSRSVLKKS